MNTPFHRAVSPTVDYVKATWDLHSAVTRPLPKAWADGRETASRFRRGWESPWVRVQRAGGRRP